MGLNYGLPGPLTNDSVFGSFCEVLHHFLTLVGGSVRSLKCRLRASVFFRFVENRGDIIGCSDQIDQDSPKVCIGLMP